jgi:hypothetical protein
MRTITLVVLFLPLYFGCAENKESDILVRAESELFRVGHKWGIKSNDGKIIVEPKWDLIGYPSTLSDNRLVVSKDGKFGFLNSNGVLAIDLIWDYASKFVDGLAPVASEGKYGFIGINGDIAIRLKYDGASYFSNNRALVRIKDQYGYIDNKGQLVIPFKWKHAQPFSEGFARVALELNNFGFINSEGELVIKLKWNNAFAFSDGLAAVKYEGQWGFIDTDGDLVIEPRWKIVRSFYKGFAIIGDSLNRNNAKYGVINKNGKIMIPIKWDSIERESDSSFEVRLRGGQTQNIKIAD